MDETQALSKVNDAGLLRLVEREAPVESAQKSLSVISERHGK